MESLYIRQDSPRQYQERQNCVFRSCCCSRLALPLNKARFGSAVSRTAKLRFPFLMLLSPRVAFGIRTMNFVKTLKRNVVFLKKIILPPFSRLRKARINRQDRHSGACCDGPEAVCMRCRAARLPPYATVSRARCISFRSSYDSSQVWCFSTIPAHCLCCSCVLSVQNMYGCRLWRRPPPP